MTPLTPARRRLIYHIAAATLLILGFHELVTARQAETYMQALLLILTAGAPELAAAHAPDDQ